LKVYYRENGIFPATHNFKDEADGTSGTDIESITQNTEDTCVIVSDYVGHKKVLHFIDSNSGNIRFVPHPETSGTFEILAHQPTAAPWFIRHTDNNGNNPITIYIENKTQIRVYYGNGAGGTITVPVAIVEDAWFHIKVQFDCATDKQSVWINGVLEVDNENFEDDDTPDSFRYIQIYNPGACEGYIDAIGYSWDTDYNIGDNREVKFHDPYNKEEITDIIEYPTITPILDKYYMGNITIRDFEGALFSPWIGRDFNQILIEDASSNVLFRGFLIKKTFNTDSLTLTIAGIGILLDWRPFGSDGHMNYIFAEGLVDVPISSDSIIELQTDASAAFTWDPNEWIEGAKDHGLLIVDKTDINRRIWISSAISQEGGIVAGGNNASTTTYNDGNYYNVYDSTYPNPDLLIIPVIDDGIAIDDTDFLQSIEVQFHFRVRMHTGGFSRAATYMQILKDTEWITVARIPIERVLGDYTTPWLKGIPLSEVGGNGNEFIVEDTDAELQKFFNKTGPTYTSLKGMRFMTNGKTTNDCDFYVHIDFIKVRVGYSSYDVSPIMEAITENTATAITCTDVPAWDETGVVDEDGFKVGQNTRAVIQDIANHSGLDIARIDNFGNTTLSRNVYAIGDGGTVDWDTTGGNHFGELDDANDATYVSTDANQEEEEYTFDDINLRGGYVTQIQIKARCKRTAHEGQTLYFYHSEDGGSSYSAAEDTSTNIGVAWGWQTLTWSGLELYDLADFQVKMKNSVFIFGGTVYCSELYVIFTISGSSFSKYIARRFKGAYCMEPLEAVRKLEGAHWWEDYINNRIVIAKLADFVDSTVDLTEADYDHDWEYEDACNQVKSFLVFGNSDDEIFAEAVDESIEGYISKQLIDESITNVADAQEIADAQLALLKTKRPSIKLPLKVDNVLLQLGTTVHVTLARPTVTQVLYPIRKLERSKKGINSIKLVIYCGLGESSIEEDISKIIRDNAFRSHKSLTDRLISP